MAPPNTLSRLPAPQRALFCRCGQNAPAVGGLCAPCYFRERHSERRFAGLRDQVLDRDRRACRSCNSSERLVVHHRQPGYNDPELLITLCAACHVRLHRLAALRIWIPEMLVALWAEQHPGVPVQLQFSAVA